MPTKAVQKRDNTKPKAARKDLTEKSEIVNRLNSNYPAKIVGFSWKGIILGSLAVMMAFNFYLLKQMNSMRGEMQEIGSRSASAQEVRVILDQKLNPMANPDALETSYFNRKIGRMREEILNKISQIKPGTTRVERIIERAPASVIRVKSTRSAISKMGDIDVKKYTIQNYRAFPKYRNFLSEQSVRGREVRSELEDIIDEFCRTHDILRRDRSEYHRVLAFRDSVFNSYKDAQEISKQKWKKIHMKRTNAKS